MHFFILYLLSLILELWFISHLLRSLHSILVTSISLKLDDGFWQSSPIFTFLSATTLNLGADVSLKSRRWICRHKYSSSFVNWKFRLFYNLLVLHFSISLLSSKCKTKVVFFLLQLLYCNCVFYRINGFFFQHHAIIQRDWWETEKWWFQWKSAPSQQEHESRFNAKSDLRIRLELEEERRTEIAADL